MTVYDIGSRARINLTLRDINDALADGTVTLTVTKPDGTVATLVAPGVVNSSTGIYYADVDLDQAGTWVYRWVSTGAVVDAKDGTLEVEANLTATLYTTLAEMKSRLGATDTNDDADIERAVIAASRAIDEHCGRRFYADTTATARTFRSIDGCTVWVDDISTTTGLVVAVDNADNGTFDETLTITSDFITEPHNAAALGRPITRLRHVDGAFPTAGYRPRVQVTAKWGWPRVPAQVREACLIKATRIFRRKDTPEGVAGVSDFGVVRISRFEDPDVVMLLAPFTIPGMA